MSIHLHLHEAADVPFTLGHRRRAAPAAAVSLASHAALALAALWLLHQTGAVEPPALLRRDVSPLVWLKQEGPGGGGGGGGNRNIQPPRVAQQRGQDPITVPVATPPQVNPSPAVRDDPAPVQEVNIPAKPMAASTNVAAGVLDGVPATATDSQGPGDGGGAGTGKGPGSGPDDGSGLGPGHGRGFGGDVYRIGSGITSPVALYTPKPQYTSDAMRARLQGFVIVECVVQTNGVCTNGRVTRSLDPTFGLDQEALKAARLFRFKPGMRQGEPVPVLVTIQLEFTLR